MCGNSAANSCRDQETKTVVIDIPSNLVDLIESYQYEVNARMNLISFCIDKGISLENEIFKRYHDEYIEFTVKYEQAKRQITETYVDPYYPNSRWSLDFDSCKLTIEVAR